MTARRAKIGLAAGGLLASALAVSACNGEAERGDAPTAPPDETGEGVARTTETGPVKATVEVRPAAPRLGDALILTLTVEAEAGVAVELPAFGEALGRFAVLDFTPRREDGRSGSESGTEAGTTWTQRYTLQAAMSGRQRIPPLRIEFLDERPGQGSDAGPAEPRELLTEAIPIEIASVLPEGEEAGELRPARPRLSPPRVSTMSRAWPWLLGVALFLAAVVGLILWRRHARERIRITAYDKAMARLARLERRGLPDAAQADAWYVELSGIVRRYLEDRFALRAPELTTEEFLREAQRSRELTVEHRSLLSSFLEGCDRVKFAGYRPGETESRDELAAARRFLDETRVVVESDRAEGEAAAPA